ncbi:MAG: CRISPR-associated endonuclease Cas2 [Lachnospiraceae bacterium]|nr:CRISPR-associated endonuclease Cas2 [Lachnospiraceae bacterium]
MIIASYDIANDKLRTKFSKFLSKFGHRLQYSVFEIDNSEKILDNIMCEIKNRFEKQFEQSDSVIIFVLSSRCKTIRYGYAKNEESDLKLII